jgi:exonuclease VII large subunit
MALRRAALGILALISMALYCGCGGPKVDEKKPVAEIRTEAQKMTSRELRRVADAYGEAVVEKRDAIDDLRDRLQDLKPEELVNQGAATLKKDADTVATSISALDERQKLYIDLLQTKVDEEKPLAQIGTEIAAMPLEKVDAAAKAYRDSIIKRRSEVADLNQRLAELKPEEQGSSEASKIAKKTKALQASDAALCERLAVYVKHIGEKGGDTSSLSLP